ncbi:MAG: hypothetical protein SPJ13_02780 [Bacteroidales bacterium]|nr:hypothetical protein [Bacteroidales bacterium]
MNTKKIIMLTTAAILTVAMAACKKNDDGLNAVTAIIADYGNGVAFKISAKDATAKAVSPDELRQTPSSGAFGTYRYVLFNWDFAYYMGGEYHNIQMKSLPPDVEVLNTDHNYLCHYVFAYEGLDNFGYYLDYFYNFENRTDENGQTYKVVTGTKNEYCGGCVNCGKCMPWGCWCGCGSVNSGFVPNYPGTPTPGTPSTDDTEDTPEFTSDDITIDVPIPGLAEYICQADDFYIRTSKVVPNPENNNAMEAYYRSIAIGPHASDYITVTPGGVVHFDITGLDNLYSSQMLQNLGEDSVWTFEVYLWPSTKTYNDELGRHEIRGATTIPAGYYLSTISGPFTDDNGAQYYSNNMAEYSTPNYNVKATAYVGSNGPEGKKYQYVKVSVHVAKKGIAITNPVHVSTL